jgi:hypothetical protein
MEKLFQTTKNPSLNLWRDDGLATMTGLVAGQQQKSSRAVATLRVVGETIFRLSPHFCVNPRWLLTSATRVESLYPNGVRCGEAVRTHTHFNQVEFKFVDRHDK